MKKINNPHDKFIKALMNDRQMALEYLHNFLEKEIAERIDFDSIYISDSSYIDENLSSSFSDIVFHARLKDTKEDIEIGLLIEHKSYIEVYTIFQILYYLSSAWIKAIRKNEKPKLIVPILFYHGKEKWEYSTINDYFNKLPAQFKKFVPDFDFIFNNLQTMNDGQTKALENQFLSASLLSMKHYFESSWLEANIIELFSAISDKNGNLNQMYLVYLLNFVKVDKEKMKQITSNLPSSKTNEIMNTIDLLRQEGIEIGLEKGMEIGMEKGMEIGMEKVTEIIICNVYKNDASLPFIAKITNLSESRINEILKKYSLL